MPPCPAPFFRKPFATVLPAELRCPRCGRFHVDREEWATRPHHTHLCEHCAHEFDRGSGHTYYTGVSPRSIFGRVRALAHKVEDALALVFTGVTFI